MEARNEHKSEKGSEGKKYICIEHSKEHGNGETCQNLSIRKGY